MIVVCVGDDHGVEIAGLEGEASVLALGIEPVGIKQAAIKQDPVSIDLQQMGTSRDLPGGPVKRDAQTSILHQSDCPRDVPPPRADPSPVPDVQETSVNARKDPGRSLIDRSRVPALSVRLDRSNEPDVANSLMLLQMP